MPAKTRNSSRQTNQTKTENKTPWWQKKWLQITFLVILALILRLYQLNTPLADWHSFRQADTASVAWEYYQAMQTQGWSALDLMRPQYQDLSDTQSGLANLDGWRMVEFPLVNALVAAIMYLFKSDQVVLIYRLVNIGLSLLSVVGVYLLAEKLSRRRLIAFLASFFLATLPFAVFYSRSILPEVALITGQIYSLLFFYYYLEAEVRSKKVTFFILTWLTLATTLLIKPVAVFIAPVLIFLAFMKYKNQVWKQWPLYILALISVLPLLGWRAWITLFPSGIPASDWLLQGHVKAFSFTWLRWLVVERSGKLILGLFGTVITLGALVKRSQRTPIKQMTAFDGFCLTYALAAALFLIVFASGNIQHDYYQNFILPPIVILLAKGTAWLIDRLKYQLIPSVIAVTGAFLVQIFFWWLTNDQNAVNLGQTIGARMWIFWLLLGILLISFVFADQLILKLQRFSWSKYLASALSVFMLWGLIGDYFFLYIRVSGYYHINHPAIVAAGEVAQEILPKEARVIAPYQTDTAFLFQTRRRGWAEGGQIAEKISQGATHYLTVNLDDEAQELAQQYVIVTQTDDYLLLDLTQPLARPNLEVN